MIHAPRASSRYRRASSTPCRASRTKVVAIYGATIRGRSRRSATARNHGGHARARDRSLSRGTLDPSSYAQPCSTKATRCFRWASCRRSPRFSRPAEPSILAVSATLPADIRRIRTRIKNASSYLSGDHIGRSRFSTSVPSRGDKLASSASDRNGQSRGAIVFCNTATKQARGCRSSNSRVTPRIGSTRISRKRREHVMPQPAGNCASWCARRCSRGIDISPSRTCQFDSRSRPGRELRAPHRAHGAQVASTAIS